MLFKKFRFFIKSTCIAAAVTVLSTSALCGLSYKNNYNNWSYTLKYIYDEANDGLCPNGQWLNVADTIGDEVLEKVEEEMNIDDASGLLTLSSAMDYSTLDTSNPKIATDYCISCTDKASKYDTETLIKTAAKAYEDYFMDNCAEQTLPLELDLSELDSMEYQDSADRLDIEATKLKNFLSSYKWSNQGYQSETNFSSLVQKVSDYIDVELQKYQSYITENGVTKDADSFKETSEYKNILLQKDYDKLMASYDVNLEAIDMYNSNMVSVVLVPTQDDEDNFYMSRTKIGVDYFATDASDYSSQAASIKQEIDENSYKAEKVSTNNEETQKKADEMLSSLRDELQNLSDEAQDFFNDFLETKRDGYIQVVYHHNTKKQALDISKNTKKGILLGCLSFMIVLFFRRPSKNKKQI